MISICLFLKNGDCVCIDPDMIFGKEAERFSKACEKIKDFWLNPNKNVYHSENPFDPEEIKKIQESKKALEAENQRQFRIVYGIAKRNNVRVKWGGNSSVSCGDRWELYKFKKRIGRIEC